MKRTKDVTKKRLFITELERPAFAAVNDGVTTLAIGEECHWGKGKLTTMAFGEEANN